MFHYKHFIKIIFSIFSLFFLSNEFLLTSQAKIKTKVESDNFLNEYWIEIVNSIKEAYEIQIISIKNNDLKKFGEQGPWIGGLSDLYSNLYKK